jgi:hypothetical protein
MKFSKIQPSMDPHALLRMTTYPNKSLSYSMFQAIIKKLITFPYLPLFISYCLSVILVFFINIQSIGQNNIESLQLNKVSFDLNKVFFTVSLFIILNFGISIIAQKYNTKYNQLFFLINLFMIIILYLTIISTIFKF